MNKQDPLWRPLEERIAVVRYLMEVGPDCGAVEIMITEIIDAFEFGERLKGAVDPLPAEHPFPYSDGNAADERYSYKYGCDALRLKQANACLAENAWVPGKFDNAKEWAAWIQANPDTKYTKEWSKE